MKVEALAISNKQKYLLRTKIMNHIQWFSVISDSGKSNVALRSKFVDSTNIVRVNNSLC